MGRPRITRNEYISRVRKVHHDKYDYSKLDYTGSRALVSIICPIHDQFEQLAYDHLRGSGCPKCFREKWIVQVRYSNNEFIEEANKVHNFQYDYSLTNFMKIDDKVIIICKYHGQFKQFAGNHLRGSGCRKCANEEHSKRQVSNKNAFVEKANVVHDNKYDYSLVEYVTSKKKVKIICPEHGVFEQEAMSHLRGCACPYCSIGTNISKGEMSWIKSLGLNDISRNIILKIDDVNYNVDGFDKSTNTIYEYYGDYWHGNPKIFNPNDTNKNNGATFGDLYNKTINRENILKNAGHSVVSVWENDWEDQQKELKQCLTSQ
jgi:hypothetical protein